MTKIAKIGRKTIILSVLNVCQEKERKTCPLNYITNEVVTKERARQLRKKKEKAEANRSKYWPAQTQKIKRESET